MDTKTHTMQEFIDVVADGQETAEKQSKRLQSFFQLVQDDPYTAQSYTKRPSAPEKKKLPGGRPEMVQRLIKSGLAETTAEKLFSNMGRFVEAYLTAKYVPPVKTIDGGMMTWDKAYAEVTALLGVKRRAKRQENATNKVFATQGTFAAIEKSKLSPEDRKNPQKVFEADQRAEQLATDSFIRLQIDKAADKALKDVGFENLERLILKLQGMLEDYRSTQEPAQVNAPEKQPAPATV